MKNHFFLFILFSFLVGTQATLIFSFAESTDENSTTLNYDIQPDICNFQDYVDMTCEPKTDVEIQLLEAANQNSSLHDFCIEKCKNALIPFASKCYRNCMKNGF